jgi:tRNA(Ile)-lysidine synthase
MELHRKKQKYNVDPSNQDTIYARNQIRHRVVPELEIVNKKAVCHIAELAEQMEEAGAYLKEEINRYYRECVSVEAGQWLVSVPQLREIPDFMQKEVLKRVLTEASGQEKDLERGHVEQLQNLLDMQTGRRMDFPYKVQAMKQYDQLNVHKAQEHIIDEVRIKGSGSYSVPFANGVLIANIFQKNQEISQKMYTKTFDYDKIKEYLNVRTYREGDYFTMNRQGQHKKINRYFIDQKIPGNVRGQIPLIADGHHILWIIGGRVSESYKVTEETNLVLQLIWEQMEGNNGT